MSLVKFFKSKGIEPIAIKSYEEDSVPYKGDEVTLNGKQFKVRTNIEVLRGEVHQHFEVTVIDSN